VNALHHFRERRTVANLEADVQAQFPLGALSDFNHLQSTRHITATGFSRYTCFPAATAACKCCG